MQLHGETNKILSFLTSGKLKKKTYNSCIILANTRWESTCCYHKSYHTWVDETTETKTHGSTLYSIDSFKQLNLYPVSVVQ